MRHSSAGVLQASIEPTVGHRLSLVIDPEIVRLSRALLPKHLCVRPQRYAPHISVVRKEAPKDPTTWDCLTGTPVSFEYETHVYNDECYFWLRAYSEQLIAVRRQLGLLDYNWACRPPDNSDCFHITIGNTKS